MIGIVVHSSVDLSVHSTILYQLGCFHIIQKPLLSDLFFKLVSSQLQVFDQIFTCLVVDAFE